MNRPPEHAQDSRSRLVWTAGLAVALGAAATTAHGLYEVARAAHTPAAIAWLYPLITDGLALVAYASTTRLAGSARRYAWLVVVLAAGLSGLAQATYLAGGVAAAPPGLRFGVGAWPAIAAAVAAHLLYLIGRVDHTGPTVHVDNDPVSNPAVHAVDGPGVQARATRPVHLVASDTPSCRPLTRAERPEPGPTPRERARTVAEHHHRQAGALPTVRELARLAQVSRGTAANALDTLRHAQQKPPDQPATPERHRP